MICNKPYDSDDFIFSIAKCSVLFQQSFQCIVTGLQALLQFGLALVLSQLLTDHNQYCSSPSLWQQSTLLLGRQQLSSRVIHSIFRAKHYSLAFFVCFQFVHPFSNSKNVSRTIFSLFLSFSSNFCCVQLQKFFLVRKLMLKKKAIDL